MAQRRDARGRFASAGGGGGGGKKGGKSPKPAAKKPAAKSPAKTTSSSATSKKKTTTASKPPSARSAGGRQAQTYRKERARASIDERRGISPFKRSVARSERMQKRGVAKKRQRAGLEAVPTAKGLAVKTRGPLAGLRRRAFKAVAKLQRSRRGADVTRTAGSKLPRWAA